mgnify:FL=1
MHFDLTITVTAILAIAAIISPIATAIINNRYQMKLKELEHQNQVEKDSFFYKRGVYEEYLSCTGRCIADETRDALKEYGKIYPLALIYFPESLIPELVAINESINNGRTGNARNQLNDLAPKIRTILESM